MGKSYVSCRNQTKEFSSCRCSLNLNRGCKFESCCLDEKGRMGSQCGDACLDVEVQPVAKETSTLVTDEEAPLVARMMKKVKGNRMRRSISKEETMAIIEPPRKRSRAVCVIDLDSDNELARPTESIRLRKSFFGHALVVLY